MGYQNGCNNKDGAVCAYDITYMSNPNQFYSKRFSKFKYGVIYVICISIHLPIYLSIYLSVCPSLSLSFSLVIYEINSLSSYIVSCTTLSDDRTVTDMILVDSGATSRSDTLRLCNHKSCPEPTQRSLIL